MLLGAVHRTTNKRVVDTTEVHTANDEQVVSTTMVRTSDKKRAIVGTKSGTDQEGYHGRILKTHSRSEYNSTSEELVDENREGFTPVITERNETSIGYVSPSIQIPAPVRRSRLTATAIDTYSSQSRPIWNWYYGGCFG